MTATLEMARPHTDTALLDVCRCGQDLDLCAGTHCPRCGTTRQACQLRQSAA